MSEREVKNIDSPKDLVLPQKSESKQIKWHEKMSKAEKIFWGTILIFFIIYIYFSMLAFKNTPPENKNKNTVIGEYIEQFIPTHKVRDNLSNNKEKLSQHINNELAGLYSQIDREVEKLFNPIESQVDTFLDFHYSVIGEYIELGTMAFGSIEEMIEDKLFGSDFYKKLEDSSIYINVQYKLSANKHISLINDLSLQDIDVELNNNALITLDYDIQHNKVVQVEKVGALAAVRLGPKVISKLTTKLVKQALLKTAVKSSAKFTTKGATATAAASAGILCGPLVWICSPVAASLAWFGTDAALVYGDEYLNRDDFKSEILSSIKDSKEELKSEYKGIYFESYEKLSLSVQNSYIEAPLKEKKRIKIKDKIN